MDGAKRQPVKKGNQRINDSIKKQAISIWRMELDYELAMLFDAIQTGNESMKNASKAKLQKIRSQLIELEVLGS